jgi:carbonic anhydrase
MIKQTPQQLLANNREWAASLRQVDPQYFTRLSTQLSPSYLWIGCSDARIPANQIIGLPPGEVFVHRNIANQFRLRDANATAVLAFAVDVLQVQHIIVCGHYGCGGIRNAMRYDAPGRGLPAIRRWTAGIRAIKHRFRKELARLESDAAREARLCELNVLQQVEHVGHAPVVKQAWKQGRKLSVHAWIYGIEDGLIRDLGITLNGLRDLQRCSEKLESASTS